MMVILHYLRYKSQPYLSEYNSFLFSDEIECKNNKLETKEYIPIDIIRSIIR